MSRCEETFPGGNVCGRTMPCTYHSYPDERESYYRRELTRLRDVVLKVQRDAEYALAGVDPHDWRKGLEIIRTDLGEIVRELETP
jgi:hypothetical protein